MNPNIQKILSFIESIVNSIGPIGADLEELLKEIQAFQPTAADDKDPLVAQHHAVVAACALQAKEQLLNVTNHLKRLHAKLSEVPEEAGAKK